MEKNKWPDDGQAACGGGGTECGSEVGWVLGAQLG